MKKAGIDIGGTSISGGIFDGDWTQNSDVPKMVDFWETSAKNIESIEDFKHIIKDKLPDVEKLGISVSASIVPETGEAVFSPNIAWLNNLPLKAEIQKFLKIPVEVGNDSSCFILGESVYGAGKDFSRVIGYTLGTGVGGGVVIDNQLLRGLGVSKLGHVLIEKEGLPCNCGSKGCLEAYCGGIWAKRLAEFILPEFALKLAFENNLAESEMMKIQDDLIKFITVNKPTCLDMFELAEEKKEFALYFWQRWGGFLGSGIASVVNILRPQAVILGGKISKAMKFYESSVRETIKPAVFKPYDETMQILPAKLDYAALLGAILL